MAAKKLGVSTEAIDRYRKSGKMPFHKIGDRIVFTESDLSAFVNACAVPSTAIPTCHESRIMVKKAGGEK
jgi:excisionase family DNA binding protein